MRLPVLIETRFLATLELIWSNESRPQSVLEIVASATVLRAQEHLSPADLDEFLEIQQYLSNFLPALVSAGFVTPRAYFGIQGFRYRDEHFPFLILFQRFVDPQTGDDYLFLDVLLRTG
jgi:hypothetical protein